MPGIFVFGVSRDTPQETLDALEVVIKKTTHEELGVPEDWVDLHCPMDLSTKKKGTLWVRAETGIFETKGLVEAEKMAKALTTKLCPVIHQILGLGSETKVEAFPVPLLLHLHSIYPPD